MERSFNMKPVYVWTWTIENQNGKTVLCHFAEATKKLLKHNEKPSPESKPVRVKMSVYKRKRG